MRQYLFLIIVFYFINIYQSFAQRELQTITADTNLSVDGFQLLEESIANYRMVLTGENHRFVNSNQIIIIKMMLFLHQHGYRYHLLELGRGIGFLANEYITTGDEELMDILNDGVEADNNPMLEMLNVLERFNRDLPVEDKIQIHGVDYTRYPFFATRALQYLIEKSELQDVFKIFHEDLEVINSARSSSDPIGFVGGGRSEDEDFDIRAGFKTYRSKLFELTIRNLIQDFYSDSANFRAHLKEGYDDFEDIISELNATLEWYHGEGLSIQTHIKRERHLEGRILKIIEKDSTAKIFGQFGRCHIREGYREDRCYAFDLTSVSKRLQKNEIFKDSILGIPIYYLEDGEVNKNKRTSEPKTYKIEELLAIGQLYLWDKDKQKDLIFPSVGTNSSIVLVNTFPGNVTIKQIINKTEGLTLTRISKPKRKRDSEDHLEFTAMGHSFSSDWNNLIGEELLANPHLYYGLRFVNIESSGWQTHFSFMGVAPNWHRSAVADYRYSNWRFQIGQGYNFIYRRRFSFYTDVGFLFEIGRAHV